MLVLILLLILLALIGGWAFVANIFLTVALIYIIVSLVVIAINYNPRGPRWW